MNRFFSISLLVVAGVFSLGCLSIAIAAFRKSFDPVVIHSGFRSDYINLSLLFGVIGVVILISTLVVVVLALRRRKPAPPSDHF